MVEKYTPKLLVVQARLSPDSLAGEQKLLNNLADQGGVKLVYFNALDTTFPAEAIKDEVESFEGFVFPGSSNVNLHRTNELVRRYHANVDPIAEYALNVGTQEEHPKPSLGICLGAQELHQVAGARIISKRRYAEGGTTYVRLTNAGLDDPLFEGIPLTTLPTGEKGFPMIFAHNQIATLADGFDRLGYTRYHDNSVTRNRDVVTVQGHPEDITTDRLDVVLANNLYPRKYRSRPTPHAYKTVVNLFDRAAHLARTRQLIAA